MGAQGSSCRPPLLAAMYGTLCQLCMRIFDAAHAGSPCTPQQQTVHRRSLVRQWLKGCWYGEETYGEEVVVPLE